MKPRPYPSREEILKRFDYKPSTGQLIFKSGRYAGRIAGSINDNGRRLITWEQGKKISRSHIVWFLEKGEWPPRNKRITHKNNDTIDDRIENLELGIFVNNSKPWYHRGKPLSAEDRAHFDNLCKTKKRRSFKNLEISRRRLGITDDEFFGRDRQKKQVDNKLPKGASRYEKEKTT